MKKGSQLKTLNDLELYKQQLQFEVKFQEEKLGRGLLQLKDSFYDKLKTSALNYLQKIGVFILFRMIQSRFRKKSKK